ncbi:MAG: heparinase II/III family protein [Aliihoeflea sp.]
MALVGTDIGSKWSLVAAAIWRRVRRRLRAGPIYRWRFSGRTPERVLIAPPDLRLADPQIAVDIYHARYPLEGHMVETGGQSPFRFDTVNVKWKAALHGFRWLRHMRAAGTDLASANARALVTEWMNGPGRRISGLAWDPDVTARRIISWLQHSSVVLQGADYAFYRAYLKSLSLQIRYLRTMAPEMPDGEARLRARIALAFACLSLPVAASSVRNATRNLAEELDRQILPDGGHISRNPATLMELLADLLPLRYTYSNQAEAPPEALIGAVERMLPALRFFRHGDGTLARFNGMGATIHDRVAAILHHDDTAGEPLLHAPYSGYERMCVDGVVLLADTGAPPPAAVSQDAQAGCLSFEMSSTRNQFIVNCGMDLQGADDFRPLARATAAHSTAVVNDTSSARFSISTRLSRLIGSPIVAGPTRVNSNRTDTDSSQGFVASHDGYLSRFGVIHERELSLLSGGLLHGADRFAAADGLPAAAGIRVDLRFHVHPDIGIFRDASDNLVLAARDGETWTFVCGGMEPQVEESIFFAGLSGPRRSCQIVISFEPSAHPEVEWRLVRGNRRH